VTWLVDAWTGGKVRMTDWWTFPLQLIPAAVWVLSRQTRTNTHTHTHTHWHTWRSCIMYN